MFDLFEITLLLAFILFQRSCPGYDLPLRTDMGRTPSNMEAHFPVSIPLVSIELLIAVSLEPLFHHLRYDLR